MELVIPVCIATAAGFVQENLYPCQPAARHIGLLGTGLSSTPIAQLSLLAPCLPQHGPCADKAWGSAELAVAGGHELALSSTH